MSNFSTVKALIKEVSGQENMVGVPKLFIKLLGGDVVAALFLSQCVYWSDKTSRRDGYFYRSYKEWEEDIGLTQYKVKRAAQKCEDFIETKLIKAITRNTTSGEPAHVPTLHYKVDMDALTSSIIKFLDNQETSQPGNEETSQSENEETSQPFNKDYTEITAKTTAKEGGDTSPQPSASKFTNGVKNSFVTTLSDITGIDSAIRTNYGRLAKLAKELFDAGYTAKQISGVFGKKGSWYSRNWKGKKGDRPSTKDIRENIAILIKAHTPYEEIPNAKDLCPVCGAISCGGPEAHAAEKKKNAQRRLEAALAKKNIKAEKFLDRLKESLASEMPQNDFSRFVEPIRLEDYSNLRYTLTVPDDDVKKWLISNVKSKAERFLSGPVGAPVLVDFEVVV